MKGIVELEMDKAYARKMPSLHCSAYFVRPESNKSVQKQMPTMVIGFVIYINIILVHCELFSCLSYSEVLLHPFAMKKQKNVRCKKNGIVNK